MSLVLRLDPWPPESDPALPLDRAAIEAEIDPTVETAAWAAIPAPPEAPREPLYFLDGVRRVDARVLAAAGDGLVHGLFGSLAVGVVRAADGRAAFDEIAASRYLILGRGLQQEETLSVGRFAGHSYPGSSPEEALGALQNLMRHHEAGLGNRLAEGGACVFADGPLTYYPPTSRPVVGVIKRIHQAYLPPPEFALAERLAPGGRTPLFAIRDGINDRYSAFLRLAAPRAIDHPLAGVVRIEIGAGVGIGRALELAGLAAAALPRHASTPARDPRAPQNLLPVGALEAELRRRLGDPLLVRRAIEKRLAEALPR